MHGLAEAVSSGSRNDVRDMLEHDDQLLRKLFLDVLQHHDKGLAAKSDAVFSLAKVYCTSHTQVWPPS